MKDFNLEKKYMARGWCPLINNWTKNFYFDTEAEARDFVKERRADRNDYNEWEIYHYQPAWVPLSC